MLTIIEKAQREISETGSLSVAARQQLWLALDPAEVNEQHPGPLTEAVRLRGESCFCEVRSVPSRSSAIR